MNGKDTDISNMGRCDVCGKPIDMEHAEDELVIMESGGVEGFSDQETAEAMARALRATGDPADYSAAEAYEENHGFKAHTRCYEKTSIPDMPTMGADNAE